MTHWDDMRTAHMATAKLIRQGHLPRPETLRCSDCGGAATEYDHYLGYVGGAKTEVQPVCKSCHAFRTWRGRDARKSSYGGCPTASMRLKTEDRLRIAELRQSGFGKTTSEVIRGALRALAEAVPE